MSLGIRMLFALVVVLSVFHISSSKHAHKKSHGPLHPRPRNVEHGKTREKLKGHIPKRLKLKNTHTHNHQKLKHHFKHKHQSVLHLKAHKKGVTFAKAPAEPQPCIDFLPCLQYRYYHCYSHEWIRNNCPKLCLYCEHQPFPEPMYGRFKTVAASYPDWCLDHSQCVAYATEACAYDDWMKLNCLRKCDVCYKDKRVKAGLLFVGPPFDKTKEDKKEEHQLNKILQFRPTEAPAKAKDSKLIADQKKATAGASNQNRHETAPLEQPAAPNKVNPIPLQKSAGQKVSPPNHQANSQKAMAYSPANPVTPGKPRLSTNLNPPVVQHQSLAAGKLETKPFTETKPASINPSIPRPQPKAESPVGIPAYSYQDLVKQELQAAKDAPSTKQFKADLLKEVQIKLKDGRFPQINTASVFVKHKVTKPKRKHVVESLNMPKHEVVKPKEHHEKHEATREHVRMNKELKMARHKVVKPKGDNLKHKVVDASIEVETKTSKHFDKKKGRKVSKKEKLRSKARKAMKHLDKVRGKEKKAENRVAKKSKSHSTEHGRKDKH